MDKKLVGGVVTVIAILLVAVGVIVWQRSQVKPDLAPPPKTESTIKKVDLSSQPKWVQDLKVTARKGRSANGLANVTVAVAGVQKGVEGVNYVVQYQTSNKGSQGALSSKPIELKGASEFSKTIDFGTCSTKSCVTHDGVTSIELELDFITSDDPAPIWTGTINL